MKTYQVTIPLSNDRHITLLFRQFQYTTDWVCQMSNECKEDMEKLLKDENEQENTRTCWTGL